MKAYRQMLAAAVVVTALIGTVALGACAPRAATLETRQRAPVAVRETVVVAKEVELEHSVSRQEAVPLPTPSPAPTAGTVPVVPVYGGETLPNDDPFDSMFFEHYGVNPFIDTDDDPLSTFAMDVDTASYAIARRYLSEGHLPPQDAVRVEEFVNYFEQDYPAPGAGEGAFAIHLEGAPSPFRPPSTSGTPYYLLQVGIQGRRIEAADRKDAVLVFVIDVSGSMEREDRLGLVKRALLLLVNELRPSDRVGIVAYGSQAYTVLRPTAAEDKLRILDAIDGLRTGGSTYAEAGLREGYEMAYRAFEPGAINRVILCSDGVANVGHTGAESILATIEDYAARGITLSAVGFGMGNYNDVLMEKLADQGNGNYAYVDTIEEARRVFVENLTGTLQVIAQDSKIQVEFDPQVISRYRLLGYENRDVADEDFRNDEVDAGEVGAGHSVTALYEVKFYPQNGPQEAARRALTVRVRYQDPDAEDEPAHEIARELWSDELGLEFDRASARFQLTAAVAEYAEILRGSYWTREDSLEDVLAVARLASARLDDGAALSREAGEFIALVEQAERLARKG
jgi:Ca-activated chloride channel family protein